MDGINIPADVAESAQVPHDLDSSAVGPYRFPSPRRRRAATWVYLIAAPLVFLVAPDRIMGGAMAGLLLLLAAWHWLAAWPLNFQPEEALSIASRSAPFPIGHASAAIIFSGPRSRPRWHVVMYDAKEPPAARALVVIDGVTGDVVGDAYVETFPAATISEPIE
jgi:peptidoglycan/LPS O-acetylase OafA/YrhL